MIDKWLSYRFIFEILLEHAGIFLLGLGDRINWSSVETIWVWLKSLIKYFLIKSDNV